VFDFGGHHQFIAGLIGMFAYVVLAWTSSGYNAALNKVAWVDIVGSLALLIAILLYARSTTR